MVENEESFADLFEESLARPRRTAEVGEKLSGTVMQVGADRVYLDLGDGLDGLMELSEFADGAPAKGDVVEGFVVAIENRVAVLAKSLGKGPAARKQLEDAAQTGIPVEGIVAETNKGGFVVEIAGVRCFCPIGQMDNRRIEDPAEWVGRRLTFVVTEWRSSRDVVVSRRALLDAEAEERAKETRARLEKGARFMGEITNVRDFGAFVDIGGLEGLVPASELGWGRGRPQDTVSVGQRVEVEVIDINPPGPKDRSERITLSMRAIEADPWDALVADVTEGMVLAGVVVRLQPFGAFVELVPGVDGLIHVSAFGRKVSHPAEAVSVGDEVAVRVDAIDGTQRRLSLSLVDAETLRGLEGAEPVAQPAPQAQPAPEPARKKKDPKDGGLTIRRAQKPELAPEPQPTSAPVSSEPKSGSGLRVLGHLVLEPVAETKTEERPARPARVSFAPPTVGAVLQVTVDRIESFGLFVTWATGRGLLPISELEVAKNADLRKLYPIGTELEVAVVDVRPDGKVRLSQRAADEARERAEAKAWMDSNKPKGKEGFGTFADLFAKSLKKK